VYSRFHAQAIEVRVCSRRLCVSSLRSRRMPGRPNRMALRFSRRCEKADAGAQSWVPDDLLPASTHSIRIAGELSPSHEWGSFEFIPADSQALLRNLTSVDVLPQSVRNVRNPRVSWWPSLLIGTLSVEKIHAAGFQLFAVEKPANSVDTTIFLFVLDLSKGHGFFYSTYKSR